MGMENTREEENKMRNETNTGKGKQAARGGRSVGRPRDGFRAGDRKTNIGKSSPGSNEVQHRSMAHPRPPRPSPPRGLGSGETLPHSRLPLDRWNSNPSAHPPD